MRTSRLVTVRRLLGVAIVGAFLFAPWFSQASGRGLGYDEPAETGLGMMRVRLAALVGGFTLPGVALDPSASGRTAALVTFLHGLWVVALASVPVSGVLLATPWERARRVATVCAGAALGAIVVTFIADRHGPCLGLCRFGVLMSEQTVWDAAFACVAVALGVSALVADRAEPLHFMAVCLSGCAVVALLANGVSDGMRWDPRAVIEWGALATLLLVAGTLSNEARLMCDERQAEAARESEPSLPTTATGTAEQETLVAAQGEHKFAVQREGIVYYAHVRVEVEVKEGPLGTDIDMSPIHESYSGHAEWLTAIRFGTEYALVAVRRERRGWPGIARVRVVHFHAHNEIDTSPIIVAFAATHAVWKALGFEPRKACRFDEGTGSFVFPK